MRQRSQFAPFGKDIEDKDYDNNDNDNYNEESDKYNAWWKRQQKDE